MSMWLVVARKRFPTPLRLQCKATFIDKRLLAGCLAAEEVGKVGGADSFACMSFFGAAWRISFANSH